MPITILAALGASRACQQRITDALRKPILLAVGFLLLPTQSVVAQPTVTNVRASQRTGTKIVDIAYDLSHPGNLNSYVTIEVSQDGGVTYSTPQTITGSFGPAMVAGTNKAIEWRAATDWTPSQFNNVRVRIKADDAQEMVLIPGGSFEMGYGVYTPTTIVSISSFLISRTEVTSKDWWYVREWALTHGYNDLPGIGPDGKPAAGMTWYEAVKWLNAKSEMEGLAPVYFATIDRLQAYRTGEIQLTAAHVNWSSGGYRLPTDAEWERAARGGIERQIYATGSSISKSQADYGRYYGTYLSEISRFAQNSYGLSDVAGNVWEWCWDFYSTGLPSGLDPRGASSGDARIMRGGSYASHSEASPPADLPLLKIAWRAGLGPWERGSIRYYVAQWSTDVGFRTAQTATP